MKEIAVIADIRVRLILTPTVLGGRRSPVVTSFYPFRVKIGTEFHDARAFLSNHEPINPGEEKEVLVKFLDPDSVLHKIKVGDTLSIWEMKQVGQMFVLKIIEQNI